MPIPAIFELECQAQHYDWGVQGTDSLVAQLLTEQRIDATRPYAELWMGVHPNAPSKAKIGDGILLAEVLQAQPALLGNHTLQRWGTLPFLFKVLSIAQPLSIQIHPNKTRAAFLHQKDPHHYPDDNHKPEMALAVSPLQMLYGFEPNTELLQIFQRCPPLHEFLPPLNLESFTNLKAVLGSLLRLPKNQGTHLLQRLYQHIEQAMQKTAKEALFLSLYPHFPQDMGLLFVFFMQKIDLPPSTAIALKAHELHGYLHGNLVECMANSDNVVRAGITQKFKDVEELLACVFYDTQLPPLNRGKAESPQLQRYSSEIEEFELATLQLRAGESFVQTVMDSPMILLTLSGQGTLAGQGRRFELKQGKVLFIGAGQSYALETSDGLQGVRASVPLWD